MINLKALFSGANVAGAASIPAVDNLFAACKTQAKYMKNSKYTWEDNPTVAKSKKKGTCVTYTACVLQRLGYLASGKYIWHDGKGFGTGKIYGTNDKMVVVYLDNKTCKALKKALQKGDVILCDDNKSGKSGDGGHVMIFTGNWTGNSPIVWDQASAQKKAYQFKAHGWGDGSRKVLGVVRMKELIAGRSIDQMAYEVIDGAWGSGDNRKKALADAHYDYDAIQKRVNEILNPPAPTPTPTPTPTPEPTPQPYPGPYPVVKKYLEPGDKGENVKRLQNYLNWYTKGEFFAKCGPADGVYGKKTLAYVKRMQTHMFGAKEADGKVGPKTIARMKEVRI